MTWLDFEGAEKRYARVPPSKSVVLSTFVHHVWVVRSAVDGGVIGYTRTRGRASAAVAETQRVVIA